MRATLIALLIRVFTDKALYRDIARYIATRPKWLNRKDLQ